MRHNIALYRRKSNGYVNDACGYVTIPLSILGVISIGGAVGTLSAWPLLGLVAVVVHFFLSLTAETAGMGRDEIHYWNMYRSLSRENQKKINLSRKWYVDLPDGKTWRELTSQLIELKNAEETTRLERESMNMDNNNVLEAIRKAIEDEKTEASVLRQVKKELG